jgi:hypothetical protein
VIAPLWKSAMRVTLLFLMDTLARGSSTLNSLPAAVVQLVSATWGAHQRCPAAHNTPCRRAAAHCPLPAPQAV